MDPKVVLLVEDNAEDEFLIARAFNHTKLPINLIFARDGQEALDFIMGAGDFAKRRAANVAELVVLDLDLPKINGLEVLKYIRADQRMRTVPVVIFTASADERDRVAAYSLGANSYVVKPGDGAKFVGIIRDMCHYWFALNSGMRTTTHEERSVC
jgi:two-component system, response regulator